MFRSIRRLSLALAVALTCLPGPAARAQTLLNASYDPTRELYRDINKAFADSWKAENRRARSRSSSRMAARARRPAR